MVIFLYILVFTRFFHDIRDREKLENTQRGGMAYCLSLHIFYSLFIIRCCCCVLLFRLFICLFGGNSPYLFITAAIAVVITVSERLRLGHIFLLIAENDNGDWRGAAFHRNYTESHYIVLVVALRDEGVVEYCSNIFIYSLSAGFYLPCKYISTC